MAVTRDECQTKILLELPASLSRLVGEGEWLRRPVQDAIADGASELMKLLGIPGQPHVTVRASSQDVPLLGLFIDGQRARHPHDLLVRAYSFVNDRLLDADAGPAKIVEWIGNQGEMREPSGRARVVKFLSLSSLEILKGQPAILFGPSQAAAYAASLAASGVVDRERPKPDPNWLRAILCKVLDLGISIANRTVVAEVLTRTPGGTSDAVVEDLIEALQSNVVEIQVSRHYLKELTQERNDPTIFPNLRDGLFVELGIAYPPMRFVATEAMTRSFAFKVNDLACLPFHGLTADQRLVNETAARLKEKHPEATPVLNPATTVPASVIDSSAETAAAEEGLTTWNQLQYLVLCLAEFLRQQGWRTVHLSKLQKQAREVEQLFPTLISALRARFSEAQVTGLLRDLVRERVSVRNFRVIGQALLDFPGDRVATADEDRLRGERRAYVRRALGREIANKASRSSNVAVVYLVDKEIERLTAGNSVEALGEKGDNILRAFQGELAELARLAPTAHVPAVLTFSESRATLQELVASEYPRVSVIAHEELPRGTNVQPVARIQLET